MFGMVGVVRVAVCVVVVGAWLACWFVDLVYFVGFGFALCLVLGLALGVWFGGL